MKPGAIKFLLVDDREENLVALRAILARDGLEILEARSGEEALEILLRHEVALAVLDVQMPGMDGFELAEMMRASPRTRHVPIIFVTANPQEQHRAFRGYEAGAVDFLVKPIDPWVLWHKSETFFQVYRQRQELAETLRLNETFVAAVGHDLKNPLNAILLEAEFMLRSTDDPILRHTIERVRASGRRMTRMIDELFDLSRVRLGEGLQITRQRLDPCEIAERVVAEHRAASPDRVISLVAGPCAEGWWDAARLAQILSNLVGNALAHGDAREGVTVTVESQDASAEIAVHNGGAIPPEILSKLFEPFVPRAQGNLRNEGLGLGLYIVQQVVLAHGGKIDVQSTSREGTTFRVRLPRWISE